ncbi:protein prune homolog 2, partial [Hyposmocoma kahamanoa]|uniref:protein prune homolog 2 n=1 Tax=Hyposmocoma kahamanoa TaxID=1477025 RepID=UPI000E6D986C
PPDDDHCSLDSVSVSMDSEDEPPEPEPIEPTELNEQIEPDLDASDDETKKSKSTSTISSERTEPIPEYSAAEERNDQRSWLTVANGGVNHTCDMKVIEPFKRVLSHGGYDASGAALIVLRACFLPDSGRPDYRYVMDNLFLYLIWSLERLVTEEYVLIVLHGRCSLPPPRYLHRCYLLVDRRLRKSLKHLYLVHPTFWIRSVVFLFKPFVR